MDTGQDAKKLLRLADWLGVRLDYPIAEAPRALADLAQGRFAGAPVLHA